MTADARHVLEAERRDLSRRLGRATLDPLEQGGDLVDVTVALDAREREASDQARALEKLRLVTDAIGRMEAGTWGRCTECAAAIGARRLHVMPWAERCVDCQDERERQQRSQRGSHGWPDENVAD